jgi:hypothetical protein
MTAPQDRTPSQVYDQLNKAWKSTTAVLFGTGIGELSEYEPYLKGAAIGKTVESSFSGRKLWVVSDQYDQQAKFFDYGIEQTELARPNQQPLYINEIKDIDSIRDALKERFIYSGNKTLGNSSNIEHSDAIVDSNCILNSSTIVHSEYVAYSYLMRDNKYTFGSTSSGASSHIVRCFYNGYLNRCFECSACTSSSDCYFDYNLGDCTDCLFSFNLRAKRQVVGNVQLARDEYAALKSKLVGEMAAELAKKKQLGYCIIDVFNVR